MNREDYFLHSVCRALGFSDNISLNGPTPESIVAESISDIATCKTLFEEQFSWSVRDNALPLILLLPAEFI